MNRSQWLILLVAHDDGLEPSQHLGVDLGWDGLVADGYSPHFCGEWGWDPIQVLLYVLRSSDCGEQNREKFWRWCESSILQAYDGQIVEPCINIREQRFERAFHPVADHDAPGGSR